MYSDFAMMCGAEIIKEQYADNMIYDEEGNINKEIPNIMDYIGMCDEMIIGKESTLIRGFYNRNNNLYQKMIDDATYKYNKLEEDYRGRGIVDTKLNELKNRLTKLKGEMGIIYAGGYSTLEKSANYDLIEDAVKACESAYIHGYNVGGSLAIPRTIIKMLDENRYASDNHKEIMTVISDSFIDIFATLVRNKDDNEDYCIDVVHKVLNCNDDLGCYDLVTGKITRDITNSCMTDIEILKAASSIISLLLSSNQYISITKPMDM
jgi:chaperonin GroEL (HSP60 family)